MVEVRGRQAHGSTPWLGLNAFEGAAYLACRLREYAAAIASRRSKYEYDDPRGASPTVSAGGEVRGSVKVNVVPGYFAFSVDRRVIPEESLEGVEREFVEFVRGAAGEIPHAVEVRVLNRCEPSVIEPDHPLVEALSRAVREVTGRRPRRTVCMGGLDLRFFTRAGVPAVAYGPGPAEVAHAPDEYVEVRQVVSVALSYYALIKRLSARRP